jgi:hypothetical protein
MRRGIIGFVMTLAGAAAGLTAGYWLWGGRPNWYAVRDVEKLPAGRQNELIIYGYQLITNTQRYVGPDVADAAMRFAGNNLSCGKCHLRAGLQPFAARRPGHHLERTDQRLHDTQHERQSPACGRARDGGAARVCRVSGAENPDRHPGSRDGFAAGLSTRSAARWGSRSTRVCRAMPQGATAKTGKVVCAALSRGTDTRPARVGRRLVQYGRRHEPANDRERLCSRQYALRCR